jgi:hypothetical protein
MTRHVVILKKSSPVVRFFMDELSGITVLNGVVSLTRVITNPDREGSESRAIHIFNLDIVEGVYSCDEEWNLMSFEVNE